MWYPADAPERPVRVQLGEESLAKDAPLVGRRRPLVILSHGTGGSFGDHRDTAAALARAGFVAAALTHTGDNFRDRSRALMIGDRARQLKLLTDHMLTAWSGHKALSPRRVGAFGFSAGGFAVLAAAGGEPAFERIGEHCRTNPGYFDCNINRSRDPAAPPPPAVVHDPRLRALVIAAPALGFTFDKAGLARVTQPMQLWRAEADTILPHPLYAEAVRAALPKRPEYLVVPNADHFDFLAPCTPALAKSAPQICASRPGFDRRAFHDRFNAAVVVFFARTLGH